MELKTALKEADRWTVVQQIVNKSLSLEGVARGLGISYRQMKRLGN